MNLYSVPPVISALAFLVLGLLVSLSRRRSAVNRTYALWCLSTVWTFTTFFHI